MTLTLHSYWRAAAPYRIRIALNLKGLAYDQKSVDLPQGEQHSEAYRALNAQGLTPALETDDGAVLTQTVAIMEWLEETHPTPPLLPAGATDRAIVRAMVGIVACDIHPLNNLRVLKQLGAMGVDEAGRLPWITRWIHDGFSALEPMVMRHGQGFAFGDTPTMADCCLIPQIAGAQRFNVDLSAFPAIMAVGARAAEHPAFAAAHPSRQPDAVPA